MTKKPVIRLEDERKEEDPDFLILSHQFQYECSLCGSVLSFKGNILTKTPKQYDPDDICQCDLAMHNLTTEI